MYIICYLIAGDTVDENSEVGTVIGPVFVDDEDIKVENVIFRISDSSPFEVNEENKLIVAGKVDFELNNTWRVNISAIDDGHPSYHVSTVFWTMSQKIPLLHVI